MFFEPFLIIVGAVLASTIGMVNAAFGGLAQGDGHVQRPDHQVTFHTVTDGPANDAARKQIQDTARYSQPSLVQIYVMSPAHFWFGAVSEKSLSNRLGATARV